MAIFVMETECAREDFFCASSETGESGEAVMLVGTPDTDCAVMVSEEEQTQGMKEGGMRTARVQLHAVNYASGLDFMFASYHLIIIYHGFFFDG